MHMHALDAGEKEESENIEGPTDLCELHRMHPWKHIHMHMHALDAGEREESENIEGTAVSDGLYEGDDSRPPRLTSPSWDLSP